MTRALTIIALIGLLVVGAAAASILGRADVSAPRPEMVSPVAQGPVANRESKTDKLAVAGLALASFEPPQAVAPMTEPLRQAFASTTADIDAQSIVTPPPTPLVPLAPPKPKLAGKPPPQKSYALLSDAQIAGIKERLKLSSSQESVLAGGGKRAARRGPEDSRDAASRSARDRRADRS